MPPKWGYLNVSKLPSGGKRWIETELNRSTACETEERLTDEPFTPHDLPGRVSHHYSKSLFEYINALKTN